MLFREDPAQMRIHETRMHRRMHVEFGVGVAVVVAVLGGPPEHALLRRRLRQHGQHELHRTAGLVGPVREIAVIAASHGEHPQPVEAKGQPERRGGHAAPERPEAGEMGEHEGNGGRVDDVAIVEGGRAAGQENLGEFDQKSGWLQRVEAGSFIYARNRREPDRARGRIASAATAPDHDAKTCARHRTVTLGWLQRASRRPAWPKQRPGRDSR